MTTRGIHLWTVCKSIRFDCVHWNGKTLSNVLNLSIFSWFSPSGCWGELGQTASHLHSAFQQTVTVWSVLSAHPHRGRWSRRFLSAKWRYCCWTTGERFAESIVAFKTNCLLYHISSSTATVAVGFNCHKLFHSTHQKRWHLCWSGFPAQLSKTHSLDESRGVWFGCLTLTLYLKTRL